MRKISQRIRYVRAADGVRLARAESGAGKPLIKAANWMTHLEYDWENPCGVAGCIFSARIFASCVTTNAAAE